MGEKRLGLVEKVRARKRRNKFQLRRRQNDADSYRASPFDVITLLLLYRKE